MCNLNAEKSGSWLISLRNFHSYSVKIFNPVKKLLYEIQKLPMNVQFNYILQYEEAIVFSHWKDTQTCLNNFRILHAIIKIQTFLELPPSSDFNSIYESLVSLQESVFPIISIEFYGHTSCHKNCNYCNVMQRARPCIDNLIITIIKIINGVLVYKSKIMLYAIQMKSIGFLPSRKNGEDLILIGGRRTLPWVIITWWQNWNRRYYRNYTLNNTYNTWIESLSRARVYVRGI